MGKDSSHEKIGLIVGLVVAVLFFLALCIYVCVCKPSEDHDSGLYDNEFYLLFFIQSTGNVGMYQ